MMVVLLKEAIQVVLDLPVMKGITKSCLLLAKNNLYYLPLTIKYPK
jgi:hypothetical protein